MNTTSNTVLVTGGSAGIGLAIARKFAESGNTVIITGRDVDRLADAVVHLPNASAFPCDVSQPEEVMQLCARLQDDFPSLNVVVNNAGRAIPHNLQEATRTAYYAAEEMAVNYFAALRLNAALLPLLQRQEAAAIVHVSSVLALAPSLVLPTYSASKAAVHSYAMALRLALATTAIRVFELMPPLVNTGFSKEVGGEHGIPPEEVADTLLEALASESYEVLIGQAKAVHALFRADPAQALRSLNPQAVAAS